LIDGFFRSFIHSLSHSLIIIYLTQSCI